MINHDVIRLLNWYSQQQIPFIGDDTAFTNNILVFRFLKEQIHNGDISENLAFRRRFSSFYVMRYVPADAKTVFFAKMDELRERHDGINARLLTESLQAGMGKYYFSFTTKMLNMLDDESYPIYDSQVATVFQRPFAPYRTRLDQQEAIYQDIVDTYRELQHHPIIDAFRTHFNCPDVGYMKILDAIFWRLGAMLDAGEQEQSLADFLQEHDA